MNKEIHNIINSIKLSTSNERDDAIEIYVNSVTNIKVKSKNMLDCIRLFVGCFIEYLKDKELIYILDKELKSPHNSQIEGITGEVQSMSLENSKRLLECWCKLSDIKNKTVDEEELYRIVTLALKYSLNPPFSIPLRNQQ